MNPVKFYLSLAAITGSLFITSVTLADAKLDDELTQAMKLEGDAERGKEVYKLCIGCHSPNGWGLVDGTFPQLSGQHRSVVIKQIADIRAGNRDNPFMEPIAREAVMGGPQAISDVASYIATLPMNPEPGHGKGGDDARAEKLFYRKCAECHSPDGGGNEEKFYPRIQGQHYEYLLRQIIWMREGKRRNANPNMVKRIKKMKMEDLELLVDYVSRIKAPADKLAPADWKNPDFE